MFVKSLTLRGFKSFASATSFTLEPGITCIVGPNGSGKSNVVDALAWVMGEASARTLRGGKMDDVIFAGTAARGPLGRAEVSLTIDNSDGALPIDYSEVTISRTMFRGGGSEYAINRTPCRLLDIQELLSDSGIGREMHVIVGQGQLDAVLHATPQERRGFIEEAAGVLKHRQRKERAVRKLESMENNLTRVADLAGEVRRQLGPLGRQAETARRAQHIQADVRDARARLLADDLVQQRVHLEADLASEKSLLERKSQLEGERGVVADAVTATEQALQESAPALEKLQSQWYELTSLGEKLEAVGRLSAERARLLNQTATEQASPGRDPEALMEQAQRIRAEERELQQRVDQARESVESAIAAREKLESAHVEEQQRIARLSRAAADRREGLAKLHGQVEVRRSRVDAGEAELRRLQGALKENAARANIASAEIAPLKQELATLKESEPEQKAQVVRTGERHANLIKQREEHRNERNRLTQLAGAHRARIEAFNLTLGSASATPAQLQGFDAVRHPLADYLRIEPGYEAHVAAALGGLAQALLVESREAAADILSKLHASDGGFVELLVGDATAPQTTPLDLPSGSRLLVDVVTADGEAGSILAHLGRDLVLVPGRAQALNVVAQGGRAVTPEGDYFDETIMRGGGKLAPSTLEIRVALETNERDLVAAETALAECVVELEKIEASLIKAEQRHAEASAAERDLESSLQQLTTRIERAEQDISGAQRDRDRVNNQIAEAGVALESNREQLADLEARLDAATGESASDQEPSTLERDRLAREAAEARTRETEARLTLRSQEERVRGLSGRAEGLEAAARSERSAREKARERRVEAAQAAKVANAAQAAAQLGRDHVARALEKLGHQRDDETARRVRRQGELAQLRERLADAEHRLAEVADSVHRDELARASLRLRLEALETKAQEELGIEPDILIEEFGPHRPIPAIGEDGEIHEVAFERAAQEKRLKRAERDLKALGKVNPLALEEFSALEERHQFLTTQLEDLRSSKRDLLQLVAEVDRRVEQVFAEAFADVAAEFEGVFERLFPGGEGRLVLTDPDDMLTTGLDVEARPPGKKIKRLSLLSGGERSLVAVALLVAIFKARPSPFYIMDEVEAALDDANLGRLISLFEELRESSQLIVITHQKRTMEVADALYGVSMRGDGVTTVVSQRLADVAPAAFAAPR